jgi:hypothetical protein
VPIPAPIFDATVIVPGPITTAAVMNPGPSERQKLFGRGVFSEVAGAEAEFCVVLI